MANSKPAERQQEQKMNPNPSDDDQSAPRMTLESRQVEFPPDADRAADKCLA